jgi:hypothetical protein
MKAYGHKNIKRREFEQELMTKYNGNIEYQLHKETDRETGKNINVYCYYNTKIKDKYGFSRHIATWCRGKAWYFKED